MLGLKAAATSLTRRSKSEGSRFLAYYHQHRTLSSQSKTTALNNDHSENHVLVEGKAYSRTAILNRPHALNALNTNMATRLLELYKSWEDDPDVGFVALKGTGRAFCAGGDIVGIYRFIKEGRLEDCKELFRSAYKFMYLVGTLLKPHVRKIDSDEYGRLYGLDYLPRRGRLTLMNSIISPLPDPIYIMPWEF